MSDHAPAWHRLQDESEEEWLAFKVYLHMEPRRSKVAVAEELGYGKNRPGRMAKRHRWDERVRAYDLHMQAAEDEVLTEGHAEMAEVHLRRLALSGELAERTMQQLLAAGETLSPKEALAYLKESIAGERLVAGEATERIESRDTYDYSKLTLEEKEELARILAKVS